MSFSEVIIDQLRQHSNEVQAQKMSAYLRHLFPFYGVQASQRRVLMKAVKSKVGYPPISGLWSEIDFLFAQGEREAHYMAIDLLSMLKNKLVPEDIERLERLVVTKSWWDSVDGLSGTIGHVLKRFPALQPEITDRWNDSDNQWLVRISLIFQLKYREETDWGLLQKYILNHARSEEFFIQKAQGWALRQYGKFHPERVLNFVNHHPELSTLTRREAVKRFKK